MQNLPAGVVPVVVVVAGGVVPVVVVVAGGVVPVEVVVATPDILKHKKFFKQYKNSN